MPKKFFIFQLLPFRTVKIDFNSLYLFLNKSPYYSSVCPANQKIQSHFFYASHFYFCCSCKQSPQNKHGCNKIPLTDNAIPCFTPHHKLKMFHVKHFQFTATIKRTKLRTAIIKSRFYSLQLTHHYKKHLSI